MCVCMYVCIYVYNYEYKYKYIILIYPKMSQAERDPNYFFSLVTRKFL